jgi:hypothetical protein
MDRPARDEDDESFYFADTPVPAARDPGPWRERAWAREEVEPGSDGCGDPSAGADGGPLTDDELEGLRQTASIGTPERTVEESEFYMRLRDDHERSQREAAGRLYVGVSDWIGGLAIAGAPAIVAVARSYVLAHGDPQTMFAILRNVNIFALLSGYLFWMVTYFAIFLFALRRLAGHG